MLLDCYKPTFARKFVAASSQKLVQASAIVSTLPYTFACWFNSDSGSAAQNMIALGNSADNNPIIALRLASGVVSVVHRDNALTLGESTFGTAYPLNTWCHAAAKFTSSSSRTAYSNGTGATPSTTAVSTTTVNRTAVGVQERSTPAGFMSGLIAWPAIWNVALLDSDIAALARGAHPLTIHPESLVAFWDFDGRETEFGIRAAYPLTNTASVPVNGPAFLRTRVPRPWMLGAGYIAPASGNRRRRTIICGAAA